MIIKNRVLKNASWIIGCKIVQSVLGLFIGIFTARYLGPGNYGLINYAASITSFVTPIMFLGFNSTLVQEIINDPEREGEILGTSILMSVISAIICMVGSLSFTVIANRNEPTTIIVCFLYSFLLIAQALELSQFWFQSKLKSKYTSLTMFSCYVVVSAYKMYLLITGKNIYWFALSNALDYFLISFTLLVIYKKIGKQRLYFSWKTGKTLLSRSKYYIISSMMITIYANTDKIMIKSILGEKETGYYSAAIVCAAITDFVFSAIIDSARPSIFEGAKIDEKVFENRLKMLFSVVVYAAVFQGIAIALMSKYIIVLSYGKNYLEAANVLKILGWHTALSCIGSVRDIWILSKKRQHLLLIINSSGALINVILNALLIPIYGIIGAAVASLTAQIFSNLILGFIIKPLRRSNSLLLQSLNPICVFNYLKIAFKNR